jgi:hypothetical protein
VDIPMPKMIAICKKAIKTPEFDKYRVGLDKIPDLDKPADPLPTY